MKFVIDSANRKQCEPWAAINKNAREVFIRNLNLGSIFHPFLINQVRQNLAPKLLVSLPGEATELRLATRQRTNTKVANTKVARCNNGGQDAVVLGCCRARQEKVCPYEYIISTP